MRRGVLHEVYPWISQTPGQHKMKDWHDPPAAFAPSCRAHQNSRTTQQHAPWFGDDSPGCSVGRRKQSPQPKIGVMPNQVRGRLVCEAGALMMPSKVFAARERAESEQEVSTNLRDRSAFPQLLMSSLLSPPAQAAAFDCLARASLGLCGYACSTKAN